MSALRKSSGIGQKEIAFKDFRHGPSRRMLQAYLRLTDQYISGLLFTLVVDKSIPALLARETLKRLARWRKHWSRLVMALSLTRLPKSSFGSFIALPS